MQAETSNDGNLPDHDAAASQRRPRTLGASGATATTSSINQNAMSLSLPPGHEYPTRLLPNPPKRKRYSIDDVTFQLGKVRVNKSGQAHINIIPPDDDSPKADYLAAYRSASDWDKHVDDSFATLPSDLQSSLREVITTRTVSARKASDRLVRELSSFTTTADNHPELSKQRPSSSFDLISAISSSIEILVLVGTYLRPRDILALYSISRAFHATLDTHMRSSVVVWAGHSCRLAAEIFPHQFYAGGAVPDPMGRPRDPAYHDIYARLTAAAAAASNLSNTPSSSSSAPDSEAKKKQKEETRYIPSLRWLQMVHARGTRVRDIVAALARRGHRLPPNSDSTLLKLWLVMDLPTNVDRCAVVGSTSFFTRFDLYRSAVFLVKLLMRTNDPLYGPDHGVLVELMLGQWGMTPLWKLLRGKGYTTVREVVGAKMRYDVIPTVDEREKGLPVLGVPVEEMGRGHLEGWGKGEEHLLRVDELVVRECARRGIEVDECVESMAVYGHVDIAKGENLVPSLEELYMSDEEMPEELPAEEDGKRRVLIYGGAGNVPFNKGEWNPKLVRKANWEDLTEEMRTAIEEDDRDEMLRSLRWEEDSRGLSAEGSEGDDSEETEDVVDVGDVKGKGKLVDRTQEDEEPGVFDDDSVLGGTDDDRDDVSDEESLDGFYGSSVCFSNMPELQSRITSINSLPVMTPPREGSPDLVGIHGDQHMDEMDLEEDDMDMDTTLIPSSLTVTPLKLAPSQLEEDTSEEEDSSDEDDSEDELDDEERQRLAAELDEELLAQADQHYSEDELEYDWDAWKEQADAVIVARDGDDEDEEEEREKMEYRRLY